MRFRTRWDLFHNETGTQGADPGRSIGQYTIMKPTCHTFTNVSEGKIIIIIQTQRKTRLVKGSHEDQILMKLSSLVQVKTVWSPFHPVRVHTKLKTNQTKSSSQHNKSSNCASTHTHTHTHTHTPSITFRHLPPKKGCCKPVLGV